MFNKTFYWLLSFLLNTSKCCLLNSVPSSSSGVGSDNALYFNIFAYKDISIYAFDVLCGGCCGSGTHNIYALNIPNKSFEDYARNESYWTLIHTASITCSYNTIIRTNNLSTNINITANNVQAIHTVFLNAMTATYVTPDTSTKYNNDIMIVNATNGNMNGPYGTGKVTANGYSSFYGGIYYNVLNENKCNVSEAPTLSPTNVPSLSTAEPTNVPSIDPTNVPSIDNAINRNNINNYLLCLLLCVILSLIL